MGLNLVGKIELDGAGFERGLHRAGEGVAEMVRNATVAAFGFYGVEEAIKKTVETASELVNTSKRLDVTVEQLQVLRQAAKESGSELGTISKAFEKIDQARSKALKGDKGALDAFAKLGVSQAQLHTQTAASLFTGAISNAAKGNSVEDIGPALKEVLGKGFGELIPTLKTDFDELGGKMKHLGSIMDTETAVALKQVDGEFGLLSNILTAQLAPVLVTIVEALLTFIGKLHSTGVGLEQLLNGKGGGPKNWWQGAASLQKVLIDGVINQIPGKVGDKLQDASDAVHQAIYGISPKEALDNVMEAGDAFSEDNDEQTEKLDEMREEIKKLAAELNNPKPRADDSPDVSTASKAKRLASIPSDALVKVGNFLGSNGNTIERVNQQKIQLLKRIADTNDKIVLNTKSGGGQLGIGIGIPLN